MQTLPVDASSLVFSDFFFRLAWALKLGIEIKIFEHFRENQNASPGSNQYSIPNPINDALESLQAADCILGRCLAASLWIIHHPGKMEKRM